MKKPYLYSFFFLFLFLISCTENIKNKTEFNCFSEQFSDIKILRYQIPGFDELSLSQKNLSIT